MSTNQLIENTLFSWDSYDDADDCTLFFEVTLNAPIGKHPVGAKFDTAVVLWHRSVLQLVDHTPKEGSEPFYYAEYSLLLSVGETLKE